jgi:Secretion system C-terminal sorting domain
LRNATGTSIVGNIAVGGPGLIRMKIVNAGSAIGNCSYGSGEVQVRAYFPAPTSASYFYKYDGPLTFSTTRYNWTYNPTTSVFTGINNIPVVAGLFGIETVDVPVLGVAVGNFILGMEAEIFASASGDNTNDNTWDLNVNVVAPIGLPITLSDFTATANACNAVLSWNTSYEAGLDRFEIEQSENGTTFNKVGTVKAKNLSTGAEYQFNWNQGSTTAFYRLKMVDKDGSITYSKGIRVSTNCNGKREAKLFPNPVSINQLLNVNIAGYTKNIKAELYTVSGQLVNTYTLQNGSNELSVGKVSQGFYTLKISENGIQTETFKVNVLR